MPGIEKVHTKDGIPPLGPYSQAVKANGFVFICGQLPLIANDHGVELAMGTIAEQTHVMCRNAKYVLEAAGSSLDKVVKVTVFLTDISDSSEMSKVYGQYFPGRPVRSCIEARALPLGSPMEIELIALE